MLQGLFHWVVSLIYLKASLELSFLFNIGFYMEDPNVLRQLQRRQKGIWVAFIMNTIAIISTAVVLSFMAYMYKFELF